MKYFLYCLALGTCLLAAAADRPRPNIVMIVADDHGIDAGCYGNPVIRTPNIDGLARDGTLYRRAFCTTASCSASRSVILSGLHNHATGQFGHAHSYHHFSSYSSLKTLPVLLTEAGYRTARIGKFHVAPEEVYRFETIIPSAQGSRNSVRMAENCRDFISDRTRPFFLYFCTSDPHRSGETVTGHPERPNAFGNGPNYQGVQEVLYDPKDVIVPPWMPDTPATRAELAQYYQSVSRVDQGVGRLVALLRESGQLENTIILYTSDNGSAMPGSKTTLYEPGMRLPLIVRAPDAPHRGVTSDAMVSWVDFTPTLLDFAGVTEVMAPPRLVGEPGDGSRRGGPPSSQSKVPYTFHGRSFRSTVGVPAPEGWDEVYASHTFHEITMYYPMRVVRTARYKLILNLAHSLPYPFASDLYEAVSWQDALRRGPDAYYGKRRISDFLHRARHELYDLEQDPHEVNNLAGRPDHREVFQGLSGKLKEFQKRTGDPWILKYDYE